MASGLTFGFNVLQVGTKGKGLLAQGIDSIVMRVWRMMLLKIPIMEFKVLGRRICSTAWSQAEIRENLKGIETQRGSKLP
jgi:hypothetical protein